VANEARIGQFIEFRSELGQSLFDRLDFFSQQFVLQLLSRWNPGNHLAVAALPDSRPQGLNGIGDRLLEIRKAAFLVNRRVKGGSIKHPRDQGQGFVVLDRTGCLSIGDQVRGGIRKFFSLDESL